MISVLHGDCRDVLKTLPDASVHMVVTSPPYWGLRDYGTAMWDGGDPACDHVVGEIGLGLAKLGERYRGGGHKQGQVSKLLARGECPKCGAIRTDKQIGLEATPDEYVATIVDVFREVRRVLRDDGTLWLVLGDSYAAQGGGKAPGLYADKRPDGATWQAPRTPPVGAKPKDLLGIPWRVAFALQADGWWLRRDIVWSKPNSMPESVTDRPTTAHEYLFLLTKSGSSLFWTHRFLPGARVPQPPDYRWVHRKTREEVANDPGDDKAWRRINLWDGHDYFYDAEAIKENVTGNAHPRGNGVNPKAGTPGEGIKQNTSFSAAVAGLVSSRNARSVWSIATAPFPGAHFATFPPELPERCIKAGTSEYGCCAKCGAPFSRQMRTGEPDLARQRACGGDALGQYHGQSTKGHDNAGVQNASDVKRRILEGQRETITIGWLPSCHCEAWPRPCTVLDPFAGAGTTGLVADRMGRDAILIELSPGYGEMSRDRLVADAPLLVQIAEAAE